MSRVIAGMGRVAGWLGWTLIAGSLLALAGFWWVDRHHPWATPVWEPSAFTALRDDGPTPRDSVERWVIAYQPLCHHCRESLAATRARALLARPPVRLTVLLIDASRSLAERAAQTLGPGSVVWDDRGVWRGRWGHRTYGEVLRFDARGAYRGPLAQESSPVPRR